MTSSSIIGDSGQSPVGNAGSVTVQGLASPASSVLIAGTGAGGNMTLSTHSLTVQTGGSLSAATSGAGPGGIIT